MAAPYAASMLEARVVGTPGGENPTTPANLATLHQVSQNAGLSCRPSWWLAIVEKAYAKLFGGYAKLFSGFVDEALTDLTGLPVEKFPLQKKRPGVCAPKEQDRFWRELCWMLQGGSAGAASGGGDAAAAVEPIGQKSDYYYAHRRKIDFHVPVTPQRID